MSCCGHGLCTAIETIRSWEWGLASVQGTRYSYPCILLSLRLKFIHCLMGISRVSKWTTQLRYPPDSDPETGRPKILSVYIGGSLCDHFLPTFTLPEETSGCGRLWQGLSHGRKPSLKMVRASGSQNQSLMSGPTLLLLDSRG